MKLRFFSNYLSVLGLHKYSARVYEACIKSFCALPVTALVDGRFFCVHGGISPELMTLDDLHHVTHITIYSSLHILIITPMQLNRFQEPGSHGLLCDLLWADPIANYGHEHENSVHGPGLKPGTMFEHNATRGCSYFFT
jgi:serine/threonine-protein phosphatase 2B catalytic subunit